MCVKKIKKWGGVIYFIFGALMEYKTLDEILYNGFLEKDKESKTSQFIKSLEDKEVMKQEAKKASKLATELSSSFSTKNTKI